MYFLLRRFFVKLKMDNGGIHLTKGLFFRRIYDIPISAVVAAEIRQAPLLRLLKGRKVTLFTLSGKTSFYLRRNEEIPFLPHLNSPAVRPKLTSVLLGAFAETRAFSGAVVFSAAISRIGTIFGSDYYDTIINAINSTAAGLSDFLEEMRFTVPRITAVAAVFVAAAWLFAYIRHVIGLSRFAVRTNGSYIVIDRGLFTLYEQVIVRNNLPAVQIKSSAVSLLFRAAPVYCFGILTIPPLREKDLRRAVSALLMAELPQDLTETPPAKALFGHIALPLGWGATFAALLTLCYIAGKAVMLRSLLWIALSVCTWYCVLYGLYMRRTGIYRTLKQTVISARKGTRLNSLILPRANEVFISLEQNPFQRLNGMCDIRFSLRGKMRLRLRNMYLKNISGL